MGWFNRSEPTETAEYASLDAIETCVEKSKQEPVIVFKHSVTCPISAYAKREMDAFLNESKRIAYLLIVQEQRPLSSAVADHFQVRHESPQALLIDQGEVKTVLNHGQITQAALKGL